MPPDNFHSTTVSLETAKPTYDYVAFWSKIRGGVRPASRNLKKKKNDEDGTAMYCSTRSQHKKGQQQPTGGAVHRPGV